MISILTTLIVKISPLYVIIVLGYIAGRILRIEKESIAPLLIYIITPVIVFSGAITIPLNLKVFSLPLLYFIPACIMCLIFYYIAGKIWQGTEKNILAYAAGTGNTGYFGLPLILAFFDPTYFSIAIFIGLGGILYESTIGFFIVAKGNFTLKKSLNKVLRLPTIYALLVGIIINVIHLPISQTVTDSLTYFKGAYIVLGMMLIGLSLSQTTKQHVDVKFSVFANIAKFLVFPIISIGFILLDQHFFHIYDSVVYTILLIMTIVPIASNTVVLATLFDTHPQKMAVTVLISTLIALLYIPLFITLAFPILGL